jgi:excisionase family DNA binding protein
MARQVPEQATFPWDRGPASTATPQARPPGTARRRRQRAKAAPATAGGPSSWLTADAAAAHLGFPSRRALYAAVERGQVPAHRLGRRRLRFKLDELDSLLGRLHKSAGVR